MSRHVSSSISLKNKCVLIFSSGIFLFLLLIHEITLYPHQDILSALRVTLLRFFLLVAPFLLGYEILDLKKWNLIRVLVFVLWIFFLPYTAYSLAEIRHVAEICPLSRGDLYTQKCVYQSWTLLPVFFYAFTGTAIFIFSLTQLANGLFRKPFLKTIFTVFISCIVAFATTFGLYTRINIWDVPFHPLIFFDKISASLTAPYFLFNTAFFALFFAGITLLLNRFLNQISWR